ncbi:LacI family DNA-binding transcriptional regulator [Bacillus massiliglaciei]|uniref:LacI family DNA-binding transcriptional regulator n=1 Tax=Bacillus massiliglaciei TaxID=1816693 RepID=UPI0018FF0D4E|nr:LacI family DNA-binding transcriptional regulator [Bacillus massiliglaciei]
MVISMPNIKMIAKQAGVSVSTVSRVLNDHPYVSPEKKKAVLQAIKELKYTRNINAVHLSRGKTNLVGVVIPFLNHPYYGSIVEGIAKRAELSGYQIVLFQTAYDRSKEVHALNMMKMKQLDGIIFVSRSSEMQILLSYKSFGPIILCEDTSQKEFSSVSIDHYGAFTTAISHLVQRGASKIGCSLGRKQGINSLYRIKAIKDLMEYYSYMSKDEWIFEGGLTMQDGADLFNRWNMLEEKPDAFIITNDDTAAGFILAAGKAGIHVPDDIAVISFNDDQIAHMLEITTIALPLEWFGRLALDLFRDSDKKQIQLDHQLTVRKST